MPQQSKIWPGLILAGGGALLIAAGLWRGELPQLFNRGINLCLACIGIG